MSKLTQVELHALILLITSIFKNSAILLTKRREHSVFMRKQTKRALVGKHATTKNTFIIQHVNATNATML